MSVGPAFDAKEQVRQAVDIVDLVGNYVQLRRQGRNFVGICPWHDDSRPSLQVNQERQSWRCWVCNLGGDAFSFVMKAESLEFREALELLADRAGIQLQRREPASTDGQGGANGPDVDKRALRNLLAWAEQQFHQCLTTAPEGEPGRAYFAERGITDDTIRRFHLGFAPDRWDWLLGRARGANWTTPQLERVGLIIRRDMGDGVHDRFRGRVMFSIRDAQSRPIAFGGRVLPQLANDRSAKYINSPETMLFSKSRELYGLDVARDNFKRDGGAIIMEGYTDCLMAHQYGLDNAVAVLGTALTDRHLQVLRRYADSVTLVLDGDAAGRRRTNEILDTLLALFEKNQTDLKILTLPEGIDPCDFISQHGSDAFRQLLTTAVDALEHKFRTVTKGLDVLTDTHRASQAAEQILVSLAQIRPASASASSQSLLREQQMLGRIARQFHLPEEQLRNRLTALRRDSQRRPNTSRPTATQDPAADAPQTATPLRLADLPVFDRDVLELVLLDPSFLARVTSVIEPTAIESEPARQIFDACCRLSHDGQPFDFPRLLAEFDHADEMKGLLVQLDASSAEKAKADRERWLLDLITAHNRRLSGVEQRRELAAGRKDDNYALEALQRLQVQRNAQELKSFENKRR